MNMGDATAMGAPWAATLAACALLALGGCNRQPGENTANAFNVVAEEGVEDVNSSIEGDQYSPLPEAADDSLANRAAPPAGPAPAKQ